MKRFAIKTNNINRPYRIAYHDSLTNKTYLVYSNYPFVKKLGELEDIEEELGIDLITLFKALTDGVYDIEKKQIREISYINKRFIGYIGDSIGNGDADYPDIQYCYRIKDYGKTWALTKEELL